MSTLFRTVRGGAIATAVFALSACSNAGALGSILGGVLGGGAQGQEVAGTIRGVDTRSQQLALQQSNGSTVQLGFDNSTKVVYNNRLYAVTALENGDEVVARVGQANGGAYYTDSIYVTRSVTTGSSGGSVENVQSLQGVVRAIDRGNGLFQVDAGGNVLLTVSLPYNLSSADRNAFNNLRNGDYVRFYGVYLNTTRVELRQFY